MSTREWKPGDVAIWDHGDAGRTDIIFRFLGGDDFDIPEWQTDTDGCGYPTDAQLRRAVVIDPEDREQAVRLADALIEAMCKSDPGWDKARAYEVHSHMRAALREFANPTPPKPDEPTGLGAVVEDAEGERWFRVCEHGGTCNSWRPFDRFASDIEAGPGARKFWREVSAVRVLSEGVTQ